jgi:NADH-quinone oxidoreductase subunit J
MILPFTIHNSNFTIHNSASGSGEISMTFEQVLFWVVAVFTVGSGILVVTMRNLFHAALAMMASFLGVAGVYILLDAGFLAAAQLLVYIGAISILVIFAIMLTRRLMQTHESPFNSQPVFGLVTAVATFLVIGITLYRMRVFWPLQPSAELPFASRPEVSADILRSSVQRMGQAFVSADAYVIPFEVASILLLAAMVGAIIIAWPKTEELE